MVSASVVFFTNYRNSLSKASLTPVSLFLTLLNTSVRPSGFSERDSILYSILISASVFFGTTTSITGWAGATKGVAATLTGTEVGIKDSDETLSVILDGAANGLYSAD